MCTVVSSCAKPVDRPPPASDTTASSGFSSASAATAAAKTTTAAASSSATDTTTTTGSTTAVSTAPTAAPTTVPSENKTVAAQAADNLPAPSTPVPAEGAVIVSDGSYQNDCELLDCAPDAPGYTPVSPAQYYAYNQLTAAQRAVYAEMRVYAAGMQPGGYIQQPCDNDDLLTAYDALLTDYPQFFWMSRSFVYSTEGSRRIVYFQLDHPAHSVDYILTKQQAMAIAGQMKSIISGIFSAMPPGLTEFEREVYLHDWICANSDFDNAAAGNFSGHTYAFSACGVFIHGRAVCEGYSRALQLLLYYAGIQNTLVKGHDLYPDGTPDYNGSHMWNIVNIGGVWGHTDCTWNDGEIRIDGLTATAYRWFHIPESELRYDHYIDHSFPLPAADSFAATYFAVNGQLFAGGQPAEEFVAGLIAREAKESRTYVEILCVTPDAIDLQALTTSLNTAEHLAQINAGSGDNPVRLVNIIRRSSRNYWVFWG